MLLAGRKVASTRAPVLTVLAGGLLSLLIGCGRQSTDYFPLQKGRTWTYLVSFGDGRSGELEITNLPQRVLGKAEVVRRRRQQKVSGTNRLNYWFLFYQKDAEGISLYARQDVGMSGWSSSSSRKPTSPPNCGTLPPSSDPCYKACPA